MTYRDVLVGLITDVEGIYRRHSEVLGRFEAIEDRFHEARRALETLDATGAKTPAAVEILDRLLEELDGKLDFVGGPTHPLLTMIAEDVREAGAARDRARLRGEVA